MDCKTARQLLEFARPRGFDLDDPDRAALEAHLAHCSACDCQRFSQLLFDDRLGKTLRDVPEPHGLKQRLLGRLRQERDANWRRWMAHTARSLAAAAAVLLLVFAGFSIWRGQQPRLSGEMAIAELQEPFLSPPDQAAAERWFARMKEPVPTPDDLDYRYLRHFNFATVQGRKVPHLIFVRPSVQEGSGTPVRPGAFADVYILSGKRFDIHELTEELESSGDQFKVRVQRPSREFAYVILYTGNLNDLRKPTPQAQ